MKDDGKIIVVGKGGPDFAIARYNDRGQLDSSQPVDLPSSDEGPSDVGGSSSAVFGGIPSGIEPPIQITPPANDTQNAPEITIDPSEDDQDVEQPTETPPSAVGGSTSIGPTLPLPPSRPSWPQSMGGNRWKITGTSGRDVVVLKKFHTSSNPDDYSVVAEFNGLSLIHI